MSEFLKELRQKSPETKKKILIGVAIVLLLILSTWWVKNTLKHLKQTKQEGIEVEFPTTTDQY